MVAGDAIGQILELARWAPSGDNTQPWRFELQGPDTVRLHGFDTRHHCVYDLDGRPSQISLGACIETFAIAATAHGLATDVQLEACDDAAPRVLLRLRSAPDVRPDPLLGAIRTRSVCRWPLSMRPPSDAVRQQVAAQLPPGYQLVWHSGLAARHAWVGLLWVNAGLRLRLPEAFNTHRDVIEWGARHSASRIPDQALGARRPTLALMRWAMASWQRVHFLNRWLGGTVAPRLEMDWLPAWACGAHIVLLSDAPARSLQHHLNAGRAVQRMWLALTECGLQHQPAITPLVFARYVREQRPFTADLRLHDTAERIHARLSTLLDGQVDRAVWLGRVGYGVPAASRSVRRPLNELMV